MCVARGTPLRSGERPSEYRGPRSLPARCRRRLVEARRRPEAGWLGSRATREQLLRPRAPVRGVPPQTRRPPGAARTAAVEFLMLRDRAQTAGDADSCQDLRFGNVARCAPRPECFDDKHAECADKQPAPDFLPTFELS